MSLTGDLAELLSGSELSAKDLTAKFSSDSIPGGDCDSVIQPGENEIASGEGTPLIVFTRLPPDDRTVTASDP